MASSSNKNVLKGTVHTFAGARPQSKLAVPSASSDAVTGSLIEPWQEQAYYHNDSIPEVAFSNKLVAGNFARGKLRVLELKESKRGGVNYVPTKNKDALKLLQRLTGSFGGHSSLLYGFGHNLSIAGEAFIVGTPVRNPDTGGVAKLDWQVVSVRQLVKGQEPGSIEPSVYLRDRNGKKTILPKGSYWARCWIPHPEFNKSADSAMRHNVELCQEVLILTKLISILAKSKMNAGVWGIADEASFDNEDESTDGSSEDPEKLDKLTAEILRHFSTVLDDPDDVSAFVPMILRVAKEYLPSKENYLTFERSMDEVILRLREDGIVRIVRGMDLPSELVTGKGDTNSWSGFGIDQDFITKHLMPLGLVVANFLTQSYLRPFLINNGMLWEDAERFEIVYDSSEIATKPDMTKTAIELFDRSVIGEDSVRRLAGVEESDAPAEDEFIRQVVLNLSKLSAPIASALLPLLPEFAPFKQELLDAVQVGPLPKVDPGSSGQDSKAKTPDPQKPGAQDTKGTTPQGRNAEQKKRSAAKGGLPN